MTHDFTGNYRELENILRGAIRHARVDRRTKLVAKDFAWLQNHEAQTVPAALLTDDLDRVRLRDIIDYANQTRASMVERKLRSVSGRGRNIKGLLLDEGLTQKDYQNLLKKLRIITGKGLRELSRTEA